MMSTISEEKLLGRLHDLERDLRKKTVLFEVSKELGSEMNLDKLLNLIMEKTTAVMNAERSSLFLVDHKENQLWSKIAQGMDMVELRFPINAGIAGHVATSGLVVNIKDAYLDSRFNPEFDKKSGFRTRSILCVPLKNRQKETIGVVQVLNKTDGVFDDHDEELLSALCSVVAISVENAQLYQQVENLFETFLTISTTALEERDPPTSGHSRRVAKLALKLAQEINNTNEPPFDKIHFDKERLKTLRYAAVLHDFGKVGVREHILTKSNKLTNDATEVIKLRLENLKKECRIEYLEKEISEEEYQNKVGLYEKYWEFISEKIKPGFMSDEDLEYLKMIYDENLLTDFEYLNLSVRKGNLTPDERKDIENHTLGTFHLLKNIPWPDSLKQVPFYSYTHHEKLDGSGYPNGLKEEEIPIESRILAIVDIYEALVAQDRPYKPAMPHEKARQIITFEVKDNHLDKDLANLFFDKEVYKLDEGFGSKL